MPFVLGGRFLPQTTVSEDGDSRNRLDAPVPAGMVLLDIEVGTRTRRLIKTRIMICRSGAEPDAAWYCGSRTRRTAGTSGTSAGCAGGQKRGLDLGDDTPRKPPELEVHLE